MKYRPKQQVICPTSGSIGAGHGHKIGTVLRRHGGIIADGPFAWEHAPYIMPTKDVNGWYMVRFAPEAHGPLVVFAHESELVAVD